MKTLLLVVAACALFQPSPGVDKAEGKKAFALLNKIRQSPEAYAAEMPFLNEAKKMRALVWNDTLAKVAEAKALDMATRGYFGHTDPEGYGMNYYMNKAGYKLPARWLASKEANYFESLNAGAPSGEAAIRTLIIDEGVPTLGHRKHLLGLDAWNASMIDVGIGYARPLAGGEYKSYVCVLIAKRNP